MVRVMITDDEQIVLDGIKFIIKNHFTDVEIVGTARTGREAIEKSHQLRPDIIFMDIHMPGINGIEAIEKIRGSYNNIKFIIVSAYEQFEYAKHAVAMGVKDYILKPIKRDRLVEVLKKTINEIEEERKQRVRDLENTEKLEKVLPVLEHGFIYSVLLNKDYKREIYKYKELFKVNIEQAYIMVLEFGEGENPSKLENKIGTGIKSQQVYSSIRNILKYKCKCIVGPIIINKIIVLVYEDKGVNEYDQRINAITLCEYVIDKIMAIVNIETFIGIGSCYTIDTIDNSYDEAIKALSKIKGEKVLHIKDITENNELNSEYTYKEIKKDQDEIIKKIEEGRVLRVEKLTMQYFSRLDKAYESSVLKTKNAIIELMIFIYSCAYRNEVIQEDAAYNEYLDKLEKMDNFFEIQKWCINKVINITQQIKKKKEIRISNVVFKGKTFIDENYNLDINLSDVSKAVSISPQYFSKIFKEELGVNFIEYLTNARMDQAKKMLKQGTASIKEISYEIGYNDPNYFSRLFKRIEGISPTEYIG